jgi:hypothetical protein
MLKLRGLKNYIREILDVRLAFVAAICEVGRDPRLTVHSQSIARLHEDRGNPLDD